MSPIPATLSEDILQLISLAERRQIDLDEFQIPRLRSCKGPLSLQQNTAAEVKDDIESFSQQVETLDLLIGDQKGIKTRAELGRRVEELQGILLRLRKDFRAALLESKQVIDSQSKSQRDELLASAAVTEKRNGKEKATDDILMKANDDVTDALRRTIGLMQGELERSVLTSQMLDSSTATLRSTSTVHDTLTSLMGTSKQLITVLEKSDWLDRMLLFSAFSFFILVVLFIIKQRILDRGLRVALWWTRFIPDFSGDTQLLNMEKGSILPDGISTASAVVSSLSTVATVTALSATSTPPIYSGAPNLDEHKFPSSSLPSLADVVADPPDSIPSSPIHIEL
ncbi:Sec20-domain-containing protein [Collybia nuda]|uniref:Sec20-domain-containing protein n=1 Tax=Collybia nuda TaxID=64659 RepID=A0A9P6CIN3_9AGAR|nr:Sec20-domain-containing protein [Collybia nuda]